MPPTPRTALITTHNRPGHLRSLVTQLDEQLYDVRLPRGVIAVVDNASNPPVDRVELEDVAPRSDIVIVRVPDQPPNLYRLWNVGLDTLADLAAGLFHGVYDVAVLNDDAVLPPGWYGAVSAALREWPAAAASGDAYGTLHGPLFSTAMGGALVHRMCPWAFVTRGELSLRADERFAWWWGDTHFEWQARQRGGVVVIPGYRVENTLANSTTVGELAEQAGRDRETFVKIWGYAPW